MIEAAGSLGAGRGIAGITLPLSVAIFRATSPAMNLSVALYIAHWLGVPIGPAQLAAGVATAAITTVQPGLPSRSIATCAPASARP